MYKSLEIDTLDHNPIDSDPKHAPLAGRRGSSPDTSSNDPNLLRKSSSAASDPEATSLARKGLETVGLVYLSVLLFEVIGSLAEPHYKSVAQACHPGDPEAGTSLYANLWVVRYLTYLLATPAICWLSDKCGRKPILIFCVLVRTASMWCFQLGNTNPWLLYLKMVLFALGPADGVYIAFIADVVPKSLRVRYICWFSACASIGIYGGQPVGQMLSYHQDGNLAWVASILAAITLLVLWLIPREVPKKPEGSGNANAKPFDTGWALLLLLGARLFHKMQQVMENVSRQNLYEYHYPSHFDWSSANGEVKNSRYGYLLYCMGGSRACAEFLTGLLITSNERVWAAGSCGVLAVCGLVTSAGYGQWVSMVTTAIFHAMLGIGISMICAIASKSSDSDKQGKMQGILGFANNLASAATPKVAMWLWQAGCGAREGGQWWGPMLPHITGSVAVVIAGACLLLSWRLTTKATKTQ